VIDGRIGFALTAQFAPGAQVCALTSIAQVVAQHATGRVRHHRPER
jgi:hypothetical protein